MKATFHGHACFVLEGDGNRGVIDKALDKVVEWIVNLAKKIGRFFMNAARGPAPANPPPDPPDHAGAATGRR